MSTEPAEAAPLIDEISPGVRAVRLATANPVQTDGEVQYRALWARVAKGVQRGDAVLLDFQGIGMLSSLFLVGLLQAHRELSRKGAHVIAFGVGDDLQRVWRVTGLSQPLDAMLQQVPDEATAHERARRLRAPST
jgi:anti-anti-sigma regulatory factor